MKRLKILNKILNGYIIAGVVLIVIATVFTFSPIYPYIWFQFNNEALASEQNNVVNLVKEIHLDEKTEIKQDLALPTKDSSLATTNKLIISSIGLNGKIHEDSNSTNGLTKGIWRVPEWGNPVDNTNTIILASHRFGFLTWSRDFRKNNSFENLPRTKVGDKIEIIWEQRKFVYEIYKTEQSTKISDYRADLILYTCKTLNSDLRVFRYAKRIK